MSRPLSVLLGAVLLAGLAQGAAANEVKILKAEFESRYHQWTVRVTLKHDDTGWDHYADAWRIVDEQGKELGKRTLFHPHVDEQPFTRALSGVDIPADQHIVYVEAHDKVHGWSPDRVRVDLRKAKGERFEVLTR